jgi:metal-responsive CopG/Arc/MetJ family transcriptional regulator
MARQKVSENKKRKKITATIDSRLYDMLDEYMIDNGYDIGDKSKLVEKLIKNQIKNKS